MVHIGCVCGVLERTLKLSRYFWVHTSMRTNFPFFSYDVTRAIYRMTADYTRLHFPEMAWRVLDIENTPVDAVHNEVDDDDKVFLAAVGIRAFVLPAEVMFPLTKWGEERQRDLSLEISAADFLVSGLGTQDPDTGAITITCTEGSRFAYSTIEYDVLEIKEYQYFANTDVPLTYRVAAEKFRPDADAYAGI